MLNFGLTPRDFRAAHFEKGPHLFRAAMSDRPLVWRDVDALLHVVPAGAPVMRLFFQGVVPEREFTLETITLGQSRRKIDKPRFYDLMRRGATLVINRLEDFSVEAKRLCAEVGRFIGAPASSNAYMSFSGDGTFGRHWDTHDVFAIQLIGRKRWRIFPPTFPLPLTYQTNDRSGHVCPTEPALELTLEQGDMLYLPRGWWHHVIPLDEGSFHLSVGIYPPPLYDYVLWASAKYLQQQVELRRSFSREGYRQAVADALERLPDVLLDERNVAEFERQMIGREPPSAEFDVDLLLNPVGATLRADSRIGLTALQAVGPAGAALLPNTAHLGAESRAVVNALRDCEFLTFDALCARLPDLSRDAVERAALDLARLEIVSISSEPAGAPTAG